MANTKARRPGKPAQPPAPKKRSKERSKQTPGEIRTMLDRLIFDNQQRDFRNLTAEFTQTVAKNPMKAIESDAEKVVRKQTAFETSRQLVEIFDREDPLLDFRGRVVLALEWIAYQLERVLSIAVYRPNSTCQGSNFVREIGCKASVDYLRNARRELRYALKELDRPEPGATAAQDAAICG
jgi:hypothetical protein